ncbi:MAG: hypothetical protein H0W81_06485 [Chloroflexi bacterium]|nr:hypothetical protein [Chloroflexota bacterium]
MRYLQRVLAWFRTEATMVGLSPKILQTVIGTGITAGLSALGLTPGDIGNALGFPSSAVAGAEVVVASWLAGYLLPVGKVAMPVHVKEPPSDDLLEDHVKAKLDADEQPKE